MSYTCKIYKLCNSIDGEIYIGSTKQKLGQRFSEHKSRAKKGKKNMLIYNHMRKLGIDKFYIELLEEKEVANKQEQMKLEVLWQEKETCRLNKLRAYTTAEKKKELGKEYRQRPEIKVKMKIADKKYRMNSRDKKNANAARYRENNRERVNKRQQEQRQQNRNKSNEEAKKYQRKKREADLISKKYMCSIHDLCFSTSTSLKRHNTKFHSS